MPKLFEMEKFEIKELKAKLKVASREDFNYLGKDLKQYPKVGFPFFWRTMEGNYHFGFTRLIMDQEERSWIIEKIEKKEILVLDPEFAKNEFMTLQVTN